MTRGEFVLQRLKDELAMYRTLFIMCVAAGVAAAVLTVYATATGGLEGFLTFCGSAVFFVGWGAMSKGRRDGLAEIYREVGDDPVGIVERRDFPRQTVIELVNLERPIKEYRQLAIAYGSSAAMMLVGAVGVYWIAFDDELGWVFAALGSLLMLGFLWLAVLTLQALRNWRTANQLAELDE